MICGEVVGADSRSTLALHQQVLFVGHVRGSVREPVFGVLPFAPAGRPYPGRLANDAVGRHGGLPLPFRLRVLRQVARFYRQGSRPGLTTPGLLSH